MCGSKCSKSRVWARHQRSRVSGVFEATQRGTDKRSSSRSMPMTAPSSPTIAASTFSRRLAAKPGGNARPVSSSISRSMSALLCPVNRRTTSRGAIGYPAAVNSSASTRP